MGFWPSPCCDFYSAPSGAAPNARQAAQLFANQQLVTSGPYALVRHPMYAGLALAAWGALLLYFTWTMVYFAVVAPMLFLRARREEQAPAAEFGEQWQEYYRHIPAFLPHDRKTGR